MTKKDTVRTKMDPVRSNKDPVRLSKLGQTSQAAFAASSFSSWFNFVFCIVALTYGTLSTTTVVMLPSVL